MKPVRRVSFFAVILGLVGLSVSLGCSIGALVVQVSTPTPIPPKTAQATFTITPIKTATFTPSPTWTATNTPTPTLTLTPSPTPVPQDAAPALPVQAEAPAPPPPAAPEAAPAEAAPAEPEVSPTPAFPFDVVFYQHDTGSPGETRITAWIRQDSGPGQFKTLSNFQVKAIAPDGNVYLSEPSGTGTADSTSPGTGDNHRMNLKLEIKPYTAGIYKIQLVEGDAPVSAEVELNMAAEPRQYVHFDFFKSK